jgi:hypothetical protein
MHWKKVKSNASLWLEWNEWKGVKGYFSTRVGKLSDFYSNICQGRSKKNIAYLRQTHSDKICFVSSAGEYDGDGIVTNNPEIILRIIVADCLAIYIYDPINRVICLLHAGRRGTEKKILKKAIVGLRENYGCTPASLRVLFSPSICPGCYGMDLWSENENQARSMGVHDILNFRICTYENPDLFYSYERERCQERMHAVLCLQPLTLVGHSLECR